MRALAQNVRGAAPKKWYPQVTAGLHICTDTCRHTCTHKHLKTYSKYISNTEIQKNSGGEEGRENVRYCQDVNG